MYNCPQCNSLFEKGEKVCKDCAFNLEKEFIYDPICPVCGTQYKAGTKRCKFDSSLLIDYKDFTVKCVRCGAAYPPETKFCPVDGSSVRLKVGGHYTSGAGQNNTQPQNDIQYGYYSEIEGYVYPKASLSSRFFAWFIDGLCFGLLSLPAAIVLVASINSKSGVIFIFLGLLLFIIPTVYSFIKDGLGEGQSWGKKSLDLMVVDIKTNTPCSIGGSMVRNLIAAIPYFAVVDDFILIFNRKGQRAGDMIIQTQVIETWHYAPELNKEENKKSAL